MAEHPEVGDLYEYGGRQVKVVGVKKRGRGWQVYFESGGEPADRARMKEFLKSAQRVG